MTGQEPGKGRFSRIAVVFDPDPQKVALYLRRRLSPELAARMPDVSLDLLPTNHAGHGQELARTVVQRSITTRGVETSGKGRVRELLARAGVGQNGCSALNNHPGERRSDGWPTGADCLR